MRKIPLTIMLIALLIGVIHSSVRATTDTPAAKDTATPTATTTATVGKIYLPAILMQQPHWNPVADPQIPFAGFTKFFDTAACGSHFFGGTNEGLYRLDPAQRKWVKVTGNDFPGDLVVAGVAFRDNKCDTVYAAARGKGLWRGKKAGGNNWAWDRVDAAAVTDDQARYVLVAGSELYLAGDFGVRRATIPANAAASYAWQDTNLTTLVTTISDNDGRLLAAVWNDGVYEWNGQTFVKLPGILPDTQVYTASAIGGNYIAGAQTGLMRAALAVDWYLVRSGVPAETTYATLAHKGVFLIGQRHEDAFRSDDDGKTWKPLPAFPSIRPDGDQGFQVRGFDVGLTDGRLYAATTSGVWQLVDTSP